MNKTNEGNKRYSGQPDNEIWFYDHDKNYYEFANFALGYPINFPSLPGYENLAGRWETSEQLFQAAGFRDRKDVVEEFRKVGARGAFNLKRKLLSEGQKLTNGNDGWHGNGNGSWKNCGSNSEKITIMRLVVREKIFQHEKLKKILWETGKRKIIEVSPTDDCWGNANGGKNWLGKILMEVRDKIIAERGVYKPATKPETISQQTCVFCSKTFSSGTGVIYDNENYCSNKCCLKQQEKDNASSGSNNEPENEENSNNSNGSNNQNNNNNEPNQNEGNQETNEPTQSKSSESSEPTQQQVDSVKDKLNQAQESDNEEDIIRVLQEISKTIKNSSDENLKKRKEEVERKLSKDKLREIICEEIKKELAENGVEPKELTTTVKQKLDELNNNEEKVDDNYQTIRAEIFSEMGEQSLNKLIIEVQKALKSGKKKEIKVKVKKLQQFINSKVDYKQNAYNQKKVIVQQLLDQVNNQSASRSEKENLFRLNNPLMWISGVLIGLVVGIGLLIIWYQRKKKTKGV